MSRNRQLHKVESLIKKLDEPKETMPTPEQMSKYEGDLFREIDQMMPQYLYKYRKGTDNDIDALRNKKIYLSSPAKLNDPTESMSYVDTDTLARAALRLPNDSVVFVSADSEDAQYDYIVKRTELMNNGLQYIPANRNRVKICSLSEVVDSQLMWSHYANEHRGYAVRYRTDNISFPECKECDESICMFCHRQGKPIFPVVYKDKRFDATHMAFASAINKELREDPDEQKLPFPLLSVIQKSKEWSYEKEWRIVCNNTRNAFFSLEPDAIFMGELIDETLACKLAHIARKLNVPLYKMEIDYFNQSFNHDYTDWSEYGNDDIKALVHADGPNFG